MGVELLRQRIRSDLEVGWSALVNMRGFSNSAGPFDLSWGEIETVCETQRKECSGGTRLLIHAMKAAIDVEAVAAPVTFPLRSVEESS